MATLSELLKELNTLPLGNLYVKTIKGQRYFYHQYFLNGVRYSKLVKKEDAIELKRLINHRKEVEKLIKKKKSMNVTLSRNAEELTGYVMNKNVVVAKFEKGEPTYIDPILAPHIIRRTHSIEAFLKLRAMDMSRTNARILKKILNINVDEDYKTPLYAYALSVSDHYWFKPKHSKLTYQDVLVNDDSLFEAALKGETNVFYHKARLSPEITTTGSFEKGWRFIDGEWWLYKVGNSKQYFSELFSSKFAKLIGVNTIDYELDNGYIRCKNFSKNYNFEPIYSWVGDNDNYDVVFNAIYEFGDEIAKDYLKLIFFDSVVNNIDRHNENVGVLRDVKRGFILSLAPNFDNNLSLIATTDSLNNNPSKDNFMKLFVDFYKKDSRVRKLFSSIELKEITLEQVEEIVNSIPIDAINKNTIVSTIFNRYNYLKDLVNNKHI